MPPLPTIGIDPGQTWTAAVLRVGDYAVDGWTMGPADRQGTILRDALNNPDDWEAFAAYMARFRDLLDAMVGRAIGRFGRVRIGVEAPRIPRGYLDGSTKPQRLPLRDWVIPRQVCAAVIGAYPEARVVPPDNLGHRAAGNYPAELRGTRPPHWGRNDARRGERDHERAAFDVAGEAARMP